MGEAIDLVDETFVVADIGALEHVLCDESRWQELGFDVSCYDDRGRQGRRWTLSGSLTGSCEVWLEPWRDGVVVHLYLRAEPTDGGRWTWHRLERRFVRPLKHWVLDVKREHDAARPAGVPGAGWTAPGGRRRAAMSGATAPGPTMRTDTEEG